MIWRHPHGGNIDFLRTLQVKKRFPFTTDGQCWHGCKAQHIPFMPQHSALVLLCNDIFDSISSSFTCVCLVCILQGRLTTEHDLLVTSTFGKTQPMKLSTMPWHPLKWIFSPWVNYQVLRICFWLIRFDSNPSRSAWGCPATQKTWCSWARDLIFSIGKNTYRVVVLIHTMWGPRVRSWSINPMKVI